MGRTDPSTTAMTDTPSGRPATSTTTPTGTTTTVPMTEDAWADARAKFSADIKSRMDSLDARISQLETDARNLRTEKDAIAKQLAITPDQSREVWEQFKAKVRAALTRLEAELDAHR